MVDHGERISDEVKEADGGLWPSLVFTSSQRQINRVPKRAQKIPESIMKSNPACR